MAGTWLGLRSVKKIFGLNFRILAQTSVFCYRTPDFVKGPFVALAKAVDLAPSDPFFDISFPSYGRLREGVPLEKSQENECNKAVCTADVLYSNMKQGKISIHKMDKIHIDVTGTKVH